MYWFSLLATCPGAGIERLHPHVAAPQSRLGPGEPFVLHLLLQEQGGGGHRVFDYLLLNQPTYRDWFLALLRQ